MCAAKLRERCSAIAAELSCYELCSDSARLTSAVLGSHTAATITDWRELSNARVASTWAAAPHPTGLVWLEDKLLQTSHAQELLHLAEPLHVPVLASLTADAPEQPTRRRVWHMLHQLVETLVASPCTSPSSGHTAPSGNGTADGLNGVARGLIVKPRHGHDAIGVYCWTAESLRGSTVEEATNRVWQSVEQSMACFDSSWESECWPLSQVPRGVVIQPLYACEVAAGRDCERLNSTNCTLETASTRAAREQRRAADDAPSCTAPVPAPADPDPAAAAPTAALAPATTLAIPRVVRSNQAAYPIELRVHVFFGHVVGATLRSHANELWVSHSGQVFLFSDFRDLALSRGARRARRFLMPEQTSTGQSSVASAAQAAQAAPADADAAQAAPGEAAAAHAAAAEAVEVSGVEPPATSTEGAPMFNPLVDRVHALLHGPDAAFRTLIVPSSEVLCAAAGLDELRVDWLLGDVELGPRVGELTYMGAAFSGVRPLSESAASGYMHCARAALGQAKRAGNVRAGSTADADSMAGAEAAVEAAVEAARTSTPVDSVLQDDNLLACILHFASVGTLLRAAQPTSRRWRASARDEAIWLERRREQRRMHVPWRPLTPFLEDEVQSGAGFRSWADEYMRAASGERVGIFGSPVWTTSGRHCTLDWPAVVACESLVKGDAAQSWTQPSDPDDPDLGNDECILLRLVGDPEMSWCDAVKPLVGWDEGLAVWRQRIGEPFTELESEGRAMARNAAVNELLRAVALGDDGAVPRDHPLIRCRVAISSAYEGGLRVRVRYNTRADRRAPQSSQWVPALAPVPAATGAADA